MRLAYVAATRARDLLVVPAVGDAPHEKSWVDPLAARIYPPLKDRQSPGAAPGMPVFKGKDTVLERPDMATATARHRASGRLRDARPDDRRSRSPSCGGIRWRSTPAATSGAGCGAST